MNLRQGALGRVMLSFSIKHYSAAVFGVLWGTINGLSGRYKKTGGFAVSMPYWV